MRPAWSLTKPIGEIPKRLIAFEVKEILIQTMFLLNPNKVDKDKKGKKNKKSKNK
jgi:hypothetical protein